HEGAKVRQTTKTRTNTKTQRRHEGHKGGEGRKGKPSPSIYFAFFVFFVPSLCLCGFFRSAFSSDRSIRLARLHDNEQGCGVQGNGKGEARAQLAIQADPGRGIALDAKRGGAKGGNQGE